jgi:hypothetical protein
VPWRRLGLLVLATAFWAGHGAASEHPVRIAESVKVGAIDLHSAPDSLRQLGLDPTEPEHPWQWRLVPQGPVRVLLGDGAPTSLAAGELVLEGLSLRRSDGAAMPPLRIVPGASMLDLDLVDAEGEAWFGIRHAMRSPEAAHGLRLITADLRSGPALANWVGLPESGDWVAGLWLDLPLVRGSGAAEKTCAAPVWPGTEGFVTDVLLTNIDTVDVPRCRQRDNPTAACDGPGGSEGEVVLAPAATLANSSAENAADVPWYQQFSAPMPPYGNDQHPYLVWNLYRIDAQGRIEQIARSAPKHAFATANTSCIDSTCTGSGWSQILGRGCHDLYSVSSNECNRFLAPRAEVIPASGVWGRCGSLFDANCDGIPDSRTSPSFCAGTQGSPANDLYGLRLVARESSIDPAANPDARWLLDAWYVVRDDTDLFNTMGYRELWPRFDPPEVPLPRWRLDRGDYRSGPVLDEWLALEGAIRSHHGLVSTPEGKAALGLRVIRLADGRYRYDYALMNYSLTRAVTEGAEPDLRVLRNLGLSGIELSVPAADPIWLVEFGDGDEVPGNDWGVQRAGDTVAWQAGEGADLGWGAMLRLGFVSRRPPAAGSASLSMAEAGSPASHAMETLVPDPAWLFGDGLEQPLDLEP